MSDKAAESFERHRLDDIQALEDEIVRMVAYLRSKESQLVGLRSRYDELARKRKGRNG